MANELEVTVRSTDDKVQCAGVTRTNPPITFDYIAPVGNGQGYTGLEGLLISLAACAGTTLVYLLRKMGRSVAGFKVNGKGMRREQPPTSLEKILLEFEISSNDADDAAIKKALEMTEELSPVWAMVRNNVEISATCKVNAL